MSQYTFTTTISGTNTTVMAGFDAMKAAFYGMVFMGDLTQAPDLESKPLANETALFEQLERWGVEIPESLENAIYSDLHDWNYGTGDLRLLGRKFQHFGHCDALVKLTKSKICIKPRPQKRVQSKRK